VARHQLSLKVRFGELDPYNHVNHAVYVAWLEAGRCEAMADVGASLAQLQELGAQVVVADLTVRYRKPAVADDTVIIETWIGELGRVVGTWRQRILRESADGSIDVLCEAEVRAGACDVNGRPHRLPPVVATALGRLLDEPS
jgi:YbgC/YbaW family acyl-CoA thioester hydrolase